MKTFAAALFAATVSAQVYVPTNTDPHGEPATVQTELEGVLDRFWEITQNVLYWKLDSADVEFDQYNFGIQEYGPQADETVAAQVSADAEAELDLHIVHEYEDVIRKAWEQVEHELKIKLMSAELEFWYDWRDQDHMSPEDPSYLWA